MELFEKKGSALRCLACSHGCVIPEGKTGICGVRKNENGKGKLLVYGKVVSIAVDPIEKKPFYHFLPGSFALSFGTVGCNFRCEFCQNWDISQEKMIIGKEVSAEEIVELAIKNNCRSVAYTYNEPTIFIEFVRNVSKIAKKKGLKNLWVTNGYMTERALDFMDGLIDAMNIDLKAFSDDFYLKNCGARLKPVLETIKRAHKKGIHIEITTLLIPGENDSEEEIESIAKFIASVDKKIPWHISRFFPMYKMVNKNPTEIDVLERAKKIGEKYLKFVHLGNV